MKTIQSLLLLAIFNACMAFGMQDAEKKASLDVTKPLGLSSYDLEKAIKEEDHNSIRKLIWSGADVQPHQLNKALEHVFKKRYKEYKKAKCAANPGEPIKEEDCTCVAGNWVNAVNTTLASARSERNQPAHAHYLKEAMHNYKLENMRTLLLAGATLTFKEEEAVVQKIYHEQYERTKKFTAGLSPAYQKLNCMLSAQQFTNNLTEQINAANKIRYNEANVIFAMITIPPPIRKIINKYYCYTWVPRSAKEVYDECQHAIKQEILDYEKLEYKN